MLFNSLPFFVFFSVFFLLYWFVFNKQLKLQNLLILVASYIFYCFADWRFLALLIGVSLLNYYLGIFIEKTESPKHRRWLLYIGLIQGAGGLILFKYFGFFVASISLALTKLGFNTNLDTLTIIIPLGISFFTFKTISYLFDVDKGKIEASKDWISFFAYISFFPTILSGPIDKAITFLPQLKKERTFDPHIAFDGLRQILWGLFKKIVIADSCARITTQIFENYEGFPASALLLGIFLYTIQMYADFSGYSDMAIGFSRLIGINITKNFDFPFFAQNIAEFWRKWHISLTAWLTEYVFTPLSIAFRDYGKVGITLAIIINFTICGMWHGSKWTFALYGFMHGLYFIPLIISGKLNKKKKIPKHQKLPTFKQAFNMIVTFTIVMLTLILIRAETVTDAFHYFINIFSKSLFTIPYIPSPNTDSILIPTVLLTMVMIIIEWIGRSQNYGIEKLGFKWNKYLRWGMYYVIIISILYYQSKGGDFIYMQF